MSLKSTSIKRTVFNALLSMRNDNGNYILYNYHTVFGDIVDLFCNSILKAIRDKSLHKIKTALIYLPLSVRRKYFFMYFEK